MKPEICISGIDKQAFIDYAMSVIVQHVRITENQHDSLEQKFNAITSLLDNSELESFRPVLRPQGSMRLGTAIRSANKPNDFDVDIVVELLNLPQNWTPKNLKEAVGRVLKNSDRYVDLIIPPEGGKRCWTIVYADGTHVDLLPSAITENYYRSIGMDEFSNFNDFELRITDKTRVWEYNNETDRTKWPITNPIGFAEWFFMQARINDAKHKMNESRQIRATVEQFPKWNKSNFILQDIVCLLKRHRDIEFEEDKDKPISMIITVLAAKAYRLAGKGGIYSTMIDIANNLVNMMEIRNGNRVVLNPVHPLEDFTDRWRRNDGNKKEENFYSWVKKLQQDLSKLTALNRVELGKSLKEMFGDFAVEKAWEEINRKEMEENKSLKMTSSGIFSNQGIITPKPNTFYGL